MKRLFAALTVGVSLAVTAPAYAATVTVTFDEPGISTGAHITNQYAASGLHLSGTQNTVTTGDSFSNKFTSQGQVIHFDVKDVAAVLTIDGLASKFSFDHRRPDSNGQVTVKLFNGATEVFTSTFTSFGNPVGFKTFSYDGSATQSYFDIVKFSSTQKFVADNFSVTTVPVPMAAWLLCGAVPVLLARRHRT